MDSQIPREQPKIRFKPSFFGYSKLTNYLYNKHLYTECPADGRPVAKSGKIFFFATGNSPKIYLCRRLQVAALSDRVDQKQQDKVI